MTTRTRAAAGLFAISAVVATSLLGVGPVAAAELPKGATIDVVDEDSGAIYKVDHTTAGIAEVGTPSGIADITAIDVDASGAGFAVDDPNDSASSLYSANAVTGAITYIAAINFGDVLVSGCEALDLRSNGDVVIACSYDGDGLFTYIGVVDKETGFFDDSVTISNDRIFALASSPTGQLYAFGEDDWDIYLVDLTAGTATPTVTASAAIYGADFDVAGTLWVTTATEETGSALATANLATGVVTEVGEYTPTDGSTFTSAVSITVWGGTLAATGSQPADLVPVGLGALLLLAAGVALAATRRIGSKPTR